MESRRANKSATFTKPVRFFFYQAFIGKIGLNIFSGIILQQNVF